MREPAKAYVVVDGNHHVYFSAPTFERAVERVAALMRSECSTMASGSSRLYRIACVEGE